MRQKRDSKELELIENLICEASELTANAMRQESVSRKTLVSTALHPVIGQTMRKAETTTELCSDKAMELAKEQLLRSFSTTQKTLSRGGYSQNFFRRS